MASLTAEAALMALPSTRSTLRLLSFTWRRKVLVAPLAAFVADFAAAVLPF